jgi:ribosomal protein S18 acetylase RimI-like enzyme
MYGRILSNGSLELRPATAADEPFLLRVYAGTRSTEMAIVPWTDEQKAAFVQMQFDAQSQHYHEHYDDTSFDVIVLNGRPVGRLYVARWTGEIRIVDIALLPEYCNRGVGSTLLRELQSEATAAGKPLRIHVERVNPALRFYERLGFEQIEDKGVYLFMEWRDTDNSQRSNDLANQGASVEPSG